MDAKEIFDGLKHTGIYVVDRDTLTTYYENPVACKYSQKNRIGRPCYEIHGNRSMCASCPIRSEDHASVVNRADLGMIFAVRSEETVWEGHPAYLISVTRQPARPSVHEDQGAMNRMSRALQQSIAVYTEINMTTMAYRQINLRGAKCFDIEQEGPYAEAFEHMCKDELHPDDVAAVRKELSPEALQRISSDSDGTTEITVRYRLKNEQPQRIMETRAIFMRDELPHYVVCVARDVTEEARLEEQATTMESTLNHVRCGVAIYDMDAAGERHIVYINDGLCQLAECSMEELRQAARKDPMYTIDTAYRPQVVEAFRNLGEGEKTASVTYASTTLAGRHCWMRLQLSALRLEDQRLRIYGTFFDVTAERESQQAFRKKYEMEKRRSQDDNSVLAYAVFNLKTGETLEMERRAPFNQMSGFMSMADFCADIATTIPNQDQRQAFTQMFGYDALMRQNQSGVEEQSIEYRRRLPTGKTIWVKSSFHLIADTGKDEVLLFYYCNDINVSKNLELMTTHMVGVDYDMMGCVNLADDSAIMLYGENSSRRAVDPSGVHRQECYSEALEWFISHAVVPEDRSFYRSQAMVEAIKQALSVRDSYEFVLHVYDAAGNIRTKKIRYTRYDATSGICFFSQTDITDTLAREEEKQEKLQKALLAAEQANAAKTSFLSRMSHDMRTPMNGVLGLAALMRDETSLPEIAKDLDQLEMSGRYLLQLINDTLDVSKIEAGKMELHQRPIDSEAVFGNILANAGRMAADKGVQLKVTTPNIGHGHWVQVMADAARLEQVVMNVLSNAIKFTPEGGTVEIIMETVSVTDAEVVDRYIVRDSGIGISEEFLPHIFEPFAQEGRCCTDRESGTGLGMSIVKQLVSLMGGTVEVKSKLNKGTEVTLTLHYPVCRESVPQASAPSVDLRCLKGCRVLLCEDHPVNAQIATRLLSKQGVQTTWAENGQTGVERFLSSAPGTFDAILMDIRMPVLSGLEATEQIRAQQRPDAKTIPIIAMTANAFDDDVRSCLEAGMNGHIAKPVEPERMYRTLAEAVQRYRGISAEEDQHGKAEDR